MRKIAGIYKITSPSGKVYIGQSWEVNERFGNYRRCECAGQRALWFSFQKYGVESHVFEIIHSLPFDASQSEMNRLEQCYMDKHRAEGVTLLNCREAGSNGRLSEETRRRLSESLKGRPAWNKGKRGILKHSEEWKTRMSLLRKGRKPNNHGKPRSQSAIERTRMANTGRKRTPEQIARMREAQRVHGPNMGGYKNKGRKHTLEHRLKLAESRRQSGAGMGERHPLAKINSEKAREIRNKFQPRVYSSRRLATEYGLSKTTILDIVHGRIWVNA